SLERCVDDALLNLSSPIHESSAAVERGRLPRVQVDPTLVTQLYQNLIGNAVKFRAPDRDPRISLTAAINGGEVILGVTDNGIGIDQKFAEHIFEPFRRLHSDSEFEGSGIGLSICRKVVERHGGRLWMESSEGEGSCFLFTLPLAIDDPPGGASHR
ncbi:MAG: ATP-binding protein, partial [Pseudomonadota bacterium]